MASRLAATSGTGADAARLLNALAGRIDPFRTPAVGLVLALGLLGLPLAANAVAWAYRQRHPGREATARVLGAGGRRARWDASGRVVVPRLLGIWCLLAVRSATDTGAALVLAPTLACRPIGPTILDLAETPGGLPTAHALAVLAVGLNVLVWLATARRPDPGLGATIHP